MVREKDRQRHTARKGWKERNRNRSMVEAVCSACQLSDIYKDRKERNSAKRKNRIKMNAHRYRGRQPRRQAYNRPTTYKISRIRDNDNRVLDYFNTIQRLDDIKECLHIVHFIHS